MRLLVNGQWQDRWYPTEETKSRFVRTDSQFRNWITPDDSPGPSGNVDFKAEANRYHLYASYACSWVSRTLISCKFKDWKKIISLSVVHWHMGEEGWTFEESKDVISGSLFNAKYLRDIYLEANNIYSTRITVPVLRDKKTNMIVSNESSEIIRTFNNAFDKVGAKKKTIILLSCVKKSIGLMHVSMTP